MFQLQQVVPTPLIGNTAGSQIWATDCTLLAHQRYFVAAPSGSGKTTFQHLLYGLRADYEGTLLINNSDAKSLQANDWALLRQEKIAIIFQDLRLFLDQSALDNILIKNNLTQHKTVAEIEAMAKKLGVFELLNKDCGKISFGQRQRIAIIRALCQPFDFLIMDEPFSHLDSANVAICCDLIMQECKANNAGYAIASLEEKYDLVYDVEVRL